jgi:hypothetical protein
MKNMLDCYFCTLFLNLKKINSEGILILVVLAALFNIICLLLYQYTIVLLRDVFHIGLVIGPRPAVLARGYKNFHWANTTKTSSIRIFSVLARFQSVQ